MQLSGLQACHGGSHFSAAPLPSDVVKLHGLLMQKKNRHFQKMKCFERNEWGRESPLMETSNVNSQRESRVGDKNQFHKVWSFHQEGPPNADLTDNQSKSLYIYSAWQYSKAFFYSLYHSYTRYVFICFNSKLHEQSDPENARYF